MTRFRGFFVVGGMWLGLLLGALALWPPFVAAKAPATKVTGETLTPFAGEADDATLQAGLAARRVDGGPLLPLTAPADPPPLTGVMLPVGQDTYRIEVDADGIYEVDYAALADAGMSVNTINPLTLQLIYRGDNVAYQFIGDGDTHFEPGEKIRFFGQAFHGSRLERQYITNNVYWLWADGTPTAITTGDNPGGYPVDESWRASITYEKEFYYFPTWTNQWPQFPNEPDAWFIERVSKSTQTEVTTTYPITLPFPAASSPSATITLEVQSRDNPYINNIGYPHLINLKFNENNQIIGSESWYGLKNVNISGLVPQADLLDGLNHASMVIAGITGSGSGVDYIYPNRVTVDYQRQYQASGDQLLFSDEVGGSWEFRVGGYGEGNAGNILVWNITNPLQPVIIPLTADDISGSGPYTYRIGSSHPPAATFIATTGANIRAPLAISQYVPPDLDPPGGAAWLAISHADFLTQAVQLAAHRADPLYGGYRTHVVDVRDVLNQYAFGLPLPSGIRNYLAHALTWPTPAHYVLLLGDATANPRQLESNSSATAPQTDFVPTDLIFVDRFQGQIASDTSMAFLTGNDLVPDVAIGRLPATTTAEAQAVVDKILQYDDNQRQPDTWMENIFFGADNTDSGGDFCAENGMTGALLPDAFPQAHVCMAANTGGERDKLRDAIFDHANITGTLIINYRGHGGIDEWAARAVDTADVNLWANAGRPVVILSADCLDGSFIYPGLPALSETFLKRDGAGSAAHWSSTGLGFSYEHTALHEGLYEGLFAHGETAIGDAILYSKTLFAAGDYDESELYTFTLQGDPAMPLMRPDLSLEKSTLTAAVDVGEAVTFLLSLHNEGLYPAPAVITDVMPAQLTLLAYQSSAPVNLNQAGGELAFHPVNGLARGQSLAITLTAQLTATNTEPLANAATAASPGLEINPGDETATAPFCTTALTMAPQVTPLRFGDALLLTWATTPLAQSYEVWRSAPNTPYFAAENAGTTLLGTTTDPYFPIPNGTGIGDPQVNYTFLVRGVNCAGIPGAPSVTVGEFDYALRAGSGDTLAYTTIGLPLTGDNLPATADDLAAAIDPLNQSIREVGKWNPVSQAWRIRVVGSPTGVPNFAVNPGDALLIGADSNAPTIVTWVGALPQSGDIAYTLLPNRRQMITIPLDQVGAFTLTADDLAANIGGVTRVATWYAATQSWYTRTINDSLNNNFTLRLGYPYLITTNADAPPTWP